MGEASQVSEVSQSEMSTATGGGAPGGEGGSKAPMIAGAIVLLLLVAGGIYFAISSTAGGDDVTGGEGEVSSGTGGIGGTGGSGGDGPKPTTTTKPPYVSNIKLACTFGRTGVLQSQMPPDDMCDFIFYTHMFYNTRTNRIEPQHGSTSAEQFMKVANSYKITTFGISLAVSLMPQFPPDQKDDIKKAMENLMNKKIMHFGALDVDVRDYDAAKSGGLQYLKVIGEVLQGKTSEHHCALGMFNASDGTSLVNAAKSASTDFPEITMLILKVHTEKASDKDKLYTMAPNPDNAAVSQYGMITLNDIKGHISSLADISEQGRYVMLSVGMFARAYRITTGQLGIAESSVVFDYPSACHCPPGICELRTGDPYDSMDVTVEVWDQKMLVFFDSAKQMVTRAKSRLDALPKNYSGIAAYNVEMDDFDGSCDGAKKFERLGVIREQIANAKEP